MRKIKFRGKDINTDKWLYGYLSWFESKRDGTWIFINRKPVIPESVGQFTGLIDVEDNEIYEGDIVQTEYSDTCIIEYEDGSFNMTPFKDNKKSYDSFSIFQKRVNLLRIKVIGNIYEKK